MIIHDNDVCKVEIVPAAAVGCYYVMVDGDPEHPLSQGCSSLAEAYIEADRIFEEICEESGQFGVGA